MKIERDQELEKKISQALENVRPFLQRDGGDIELVSVSEDVTVFVRLLGACGTCPTSLFTLKAGVEQYLKKEIPQVKEVLNVD